MLNKSYTEENLSAAKQFLEDNSYVQLQEAFSDESFLQSIRDLDFTENKDIMHHCFMEAEFVVPAELKDMLAKFDVSVTSGKVFKLRWKDYSMISDADSALIGHEVIIDATPLWDENAGGAIVYIDAEGESIPIEATPNSVTIIAAKNMHRFFQYVNHYGDGRDRVFVILR